MAMFYLCVHCWMQTREKHFVPNPASLQQLITAIGKGDAGEIRNGWALLPQPLGQLIEKPLAADIDSGDQSIRDLLQCDFEDALEKWEGQNGQWIQYLNVIAATSPMVGLLGTVSGMISAFQTIAAGGMGKPELLAGDIGEALVTTATGLVIGIPAMVAYFVMRNRMLTRAMEIRDVAGQVIEARTAINPRPERPIPESAPASHSPALSRIPHSAT